MVQIRLGARFFGASVSFGMLRKVLLAFAAPEFHFSHDPLENRL
jgi:hypothetical protein